MKNINWIAFIKPYYNSQSNGFTKVLEAPGRVSLKLSLSW